MHPECERDLARARVNTQTGGTPVPEEASLAIDVDARSLIYESELQEEFSQPLVDYGGDAVRASLIWKISGILLLVCALFAASFNRMGSPIPLQEKQFTVDGSLGVTERDMSLESLRVAHELLSREQEEHALAPEEFTERQRVGFALLLRALGGDPRTIALTAAERGE